MGASRTWPPCPNRSTVRPAKARAQEIPLMITLRPWKGTKNTYEADITLTAPDGRKVRQRVKAPVTGKSAAERWARAREQELLAELLAPPPPEPLPERPPGPHSP